MLGLKGVLRKGCLPGEAVGSTSTHWVVPSCLGVGALLTHPASLPKIPIPAHRPQGPMSRGLTSSRFMGRGDTGWPRGTERQVSLSGICHSHDPQCTDTPFTWATPPVSSRAECIPAWPWHQLRPSPVLKALGPFWGVCPHPAGSVSHEGGIPAPPATLVAVPEPLLLLQEAFPEHRTPSSSSDVRSAGDHFPGPADAAPGFAQAQLAAQRSHRWPLSPT